MPGIPQIAPYPMPTAGDLPANATDWRPDPRRAILLVHDMQAYFLRPFPDGTSPGEDLVHNTAMLRAHCAALGIPVAYTAQPGGMSDEQRGLLKDFWGPGMRAEPADRQVIPAVAPADGDWMLRKLRYSALFASGLLDRMRAHDRDQLVICGVYGHVGVLMTAVDAFTNDIRPFVVADAIADFSEQYHRFTLSYAAARCAVVSTTESVIAALAPAEAPR